MPSPLALKRKLETIDLTKVQVVDLTGDAAPPPPKIARTAPPNQSQARPPLNREVRNEVIDINDDDEDVLGEVSYNLQL
jgi:hypothetical protein